MKGAINPGKPLVHTICAAPHTAGARIIQEIARPSPRPAQANGAPARNQRYFCHAGGDWEGFVNVSENTTISLRLQLDAEACGEGVLLLQESDDVNLSLKPELAPGKHFVLRVSKTITKLRIVDLANKIVATLVVHGEGWIDRAGTQHALPYGTPKKAKGDRGEWREGRRHGRSTVDRSARYSGLW